MGGKERQKPSTLDELIREKETELVSLRRLKMKRMEIQFFRGVAGVATSVANKLESGESLGPTERLFRQRLYEGLSVREILALLYDKLFRRRKAVIFTPKTP